ncbi:DUF6959 family protein [Rugosimonospora africana]|uniref:DUF6959 family protein n=1 Tax=Rugosimonospora africana TaxID=556532 RepID=UPI0019425C9A|nr:hypothetical protein [Rugosimonospora africana]
MVWVEVELLTQQHSNAVLRLPARRFPGVLVQGDSLQVLTEDLERAQRALQRGEVADAQDELDSLVASLRELRDTYVAVLDAAGVPLPFNRPSAG